jgi:hypothetical protein
MLFLPISLRRDGRLAQLSALSAPAQPCHSETPRCTYIPKTAPPSYFSLSFSFPSLFADSRNVRNCGAASSSRIHCS